MFSASAVDFPSVDSALRNAQPAPHVRPSYLPFRRISLPTAPSLMHRESIISVASFDSLPEEGAPMFGSLPTVVQNIHHPRKTKPSIERPRRGTRKRNTSLKSVDDAMEIKRRKVVEEFFETERAYVDGLELIYSHFLTPIIVSLDTPNPILPRSTLTSIFSNFIDIWNFHRSFFASLSILLSSNSNGPPPPLSSLLLAHFPYLSLYNPFVTAFPTTISSLTNLISPSSPEYNATFALFMARQEADFRCGKLKLRDWLLTIVQRCPRYLLLLKDLIGCTNPEDAEHAQLTAVHTLVSKITLSLNTSLHTHAQTLSLLALQRSTPNLPFQLIAPGRNLVKRGSLLQIERSAQPREREFLLFSDCLLWLAGEESERVWKTDWGIGKSTSEEISVARTRSKSEAELKPSKGQDAARKSGDERRVFKGKAELIDLEVIVSPFREVGEERRFEVLSPEGSFVLYASSEGERDEWSSAIRHAKAQLLVSLNITHPNSTLTSSSSTNHIRRSLQALPFPPSDERVEQIKKGKTKRSSGEAGAERRGKVEHWVPAIWIPDEKTEGCMRCGRSFGWRRRRHHCRLCGRCVCAACSGRTFFVTDPSSKDQSSSKPARACDACYETVFPLLDDPRRTSSSSTTASGPAKPDPLASLSNFPSWLSMPSLPVTPAPHALMAIDLEREMERGSPMRGEYLDLPDQRGRVRMKVKVHARPRSYHQILEDFEVREGDGEAGVDVDVDRGPALRLSPPPGDESGASTVLQELDEEQSEDRAVHDGDERAVHFAPEAEVGGTAADRRQRMMSVPGLSMSSSPSPSPSPRKEDTARRSKRFSLPAVAVQAAVVTTRSGNVDGGSSDSLTEESETAGGVHGVLKKRFSLMLGGRSQQMQGSEDANKGVVAGKLSELLLGRR